LLRDRTVLSTMRRAWQRRRALLPIEGFTFDRPLVVLQSDDWGRVGISGRAAWEELRSLGLNLGESAYDFYSLETAEDVAAITLLLRRHRDSIARRACLGMNFILANVEFAKIGAGDFREIHLRTLANGFPEGWSRPGLFEAYRAGMDWGVLSPALHGLTHFCRTAVTRYLNDRGERGILLRTLWEARVPYIYWRMPWVGFEYWDAEQHPDESFLSPQNQKNLIDTAAKAFADFFLRSPRSACAPGYRANCATHKAWAANGIRVAQNGLGHMIAPHFDENGILHLYRSIDFEPAVHESFSLAACLRSAQDYFARGLPLIVSVHSINFHSTLKNFCSHTITLLDEFLTGLEANNEDLLYLRDEDLWNVVETGRLASREGTVRIRVTKRKFLPGAIATGRTA
jgi:hypothetical protein